MADQKPAPETEIHPPPLFNIHYDENGEPVDTARDSEAQSSESERATKTRKR